jgi:Leucine-rich repeat (LRR) protein
LTAFDYGWLNPEILTELELKNNNLVSTDIEIFSRLVNLARLEIGNEDS